VKRKDAGGYAKLRGVDPHIDVYDLTERWVNDVELDVHPSFVTLRLVRCAGGEPTAEEEEAAATVLVPRRKLRAAGVEDGSSLLAVFAVQQSNAGASS
jgi:hypothetical protein